MNGHLYVIRCETDELLAAYTVTSWIWDGGKRHRVRQNVEREGYPVTRIYQAAYPAETFWHLVGGEEVDAEMWRAPIIDAVARLETAAELDLLADVLKGSHVWQVSYRKCSDGAQVTRRFANALAARKWRDLLNRHGCEGVACKTFVVAAWERVSEPESEQDNQRAVQRRRSAERREQSPAQVRAGAVLQYITDNPGQGVTACARALKLNPRDVENTVRLTLLPKGLIVRAERGKYLPAIP